MGEHLSVPSVPVQDTTIIETAKLCFNSACSYYKDHKDIDPVANDTGIYLRLTHPDNIDFCDVYLRESTITFVFLGETDELSTPEDDVDKEDSNETIITWHRHMRERAEYYVTSIVQHMRNHNFNGDFHDYVLSFGGHSRGGILALYAASDFSLHLSHAHKLKVGCVLCIGAPNVPSPFNGIDRSKCVWVVRRRDQDRKLGKEPDFLSYGEQIIKLDESESDPHGASQYIYDLLDFLLSTPAK